MLSTDKLPQDPAVFALKLVDTNTCLLIRGETYHILSERTQHSMEMYGIPAWGQTRNDALPWAEFRYWSDTIDYKISMMFKRQPTSDNPTEEEQIAAVNYMAPIVICVSSPSPSRGITHYKMTPSYTPPPPPPDPNNPAEVLAAQNRPKLPLYSYDWPPERWSGAYADVDRDRSQTILVPGADRTLGFPFTIPGRHSLCKIDEFMVLGANDDESTMDPDSGEAGIPSYRFPIEVEGATIEDASWDETSGKICLAAADDSQIWIVDYGV